MTSFRRVLSSILRIAAVTVCAAFVVGGFLAHRAYRAFESDLPPHLDVVTDYRPLRASQVFSADGELIGEFYVEKRVLLPIEQIPRTSGRPSSPPRTTASTRTAASTTWASCAPPGPTCAPGTSCRAARPSRSRSPSCCIVGKERVARAQDPRGHAGPPHRGALTKDQILGIYLNHVYLGHGAYGVAGRGGRLLRQGRQGSRRRRGGDARRPAQGARTRDALPRLPKRARRASTTSSTRCRSSGSSRRRRPRRRAHEALVLVSRDAPPQPRRRALLRRDTSASYVADNYGDEELLERGLRIYTTLDMREQRAAEAARARRPRGPAAPPRVPRPDRPPRRRAAAPPAARAAAAPRPRRAPRSTMTSRTTTC